MDGINGTHTRSATLEHSPAGEVAEVMLIDSIPLFRAGFALVVAKAANLKWLGAPASVHAALALAQRANPDIAVVDSTLDPFGSLCQQLTHEYGVRTVMVVHEESPKGMQQAANALRIGAHGGVPRTADPGLLIDTLKRIHHGPRQPNGRPVRQERPAAQQGAPLSNREFEVLHLIANGLENNEIGVSLFVSPETVRTHVKNVLRKLNARNRSHAIAIALTHGLVKNPTVLPRPRG